MLINLSSSNTRTGGQNAYDFTNDFDEPIEFKRNASVKVLKVWLNRQNTYVVDGTNRRFSVGFGDPSAPKNVGYLTPATYTSLGLATELQNAFNKIGLATGYLFNVTYADGTNPTDPSSYFVEWMFKEPEKLLSFPSGSLITTNFTYTELDGNLVGSADANAKAWRSETKLYLDNIPTLAQNGAGWEFQKLLTTTGCIVGMCRDNPVPGTDVSIPFQIVFGGTGATDLSVGTFIIREDNNGFNQTITYGEAAYNTLDKFRLVTTNESEHLVYQRNIWNAGTGVFTGWETIAVNQNLQQEFNKFGAWNCGVMTSANVGLLTTTTLNGIQGTTTSSYNNTEAGLDTETNPSTTMGQDDPAGATGGVYCIVAGALSVNGATFSDVASLIPAGSSGRFSGCMSNGLARTGDITFGFQDNPATKVTNAMTFSFFWDAGAGTLEARAGGVIVGTAVADANWDANEQVTIQREIHGSQSVITWWYVDNANTDVLLATQGSGGFGALYLSVGARVVNEGVQQLQVGSLLGDTGGEDITFYPDQIGSMIGFRNESYYVAVGKGSMDSDSEPTETTERNPNVCLNITNLPIKSYQGLDGKVTKMVQSLDRKNGGGQSEVEIFNPVNIELHNAEPLMFNQLHITLTNNDGTYATDYIQSTNILVEVSKQEGTA